MDTEQLVSKIQGGIMELYSMPGQDLPPTKEIREHLAQARKSISKVEEYLEAEEKSGGQLVVEQKTFSEVPVGDCFCYTVGGIPLIKVAEEQAEIAGLANKINHSAIKVVLHIKTPRLYKTSRDGN